ncbi:PaaI family thioesterase [Methanococcoides alaskense]|uniref:Acyl-CoA thioesterase n=1 Tax=Methanococcoides alaskense TaxID=325778 RepID=A0AA90TZX7_9EURY|nr:PaaI family thioesterase [Methanococcoides alaskense]MDA0524873.1 PaaI family thioesterase [Methanococcoides alaskense]MDR6223001.1 acyl-CoA thioesterase [Methanococcoides alaskense]
MEKIKEFFKMDKFAEYIDVKLLEVSEGYAKAKMEIHEHHLNGVGIVQGGAIFTLADFAFAAASNSHGTVAVAINANISFVTSTTSGTLYAQARENSKNPKIATYTVDITDEEGNAIAIFQGMAYRKKISVDSFLS